MTSEERTAWLTERQTGLGGTDLASICGVGFQDAAAVYEEKIANAPVDRPPTILMRLGLASEDFNAELYAERTGARLVAPGLVRAKVEPWAFATYDRVRCDEPFITMAGDRVQVNYGCPVELKWTPFFGDEWGADGTDEVRDGYVVQTVWEALILRLNGHDVRRTDISVLSGTGEHRVYPIPFDEQLGAMLLEIGRAFWGRVVARTGVDDWRHPLLADVEKRLVEIRPDTTVKLPDEALELADAYERYKADEKTGKQGAEVVRARLIELLDGAETGLLPDGRRVQQKVIHRGAFTVEPTSYPKFSILKAKKGKVRDE